MVIFESTPYPYDYVYLKFKSKSRVIGGPLCEFLNGHIVADKTNAETICVVNKTKSGPKEGSYPKEKFHELLEKAFNLDKKDALGPLEDYAIQPEGNLLLPEVKQFIANYT